METHRKMVEDGLKEMVDIKKLLSKINKSLKELNKPITTFPILKSALVLCELKDYKNLDLKTLGKLIQDKANEYLALNRDFVSFGNTSLAKELVYELKYLQINFEEFKKEINESTFSEMKTLSELAGNDVLPEKRVVSSLKPILVDNKKGKNMKFKDKNFEKEYNKFIAQGYSHREAMKKVKDAKLTSEKIQEKASAADEYGTNLLVITWRNTVTRRNTLCKYLVEQYAKRVKKDNFDENLFLKLILNVISDDMKKACEKDDILDVWKNTDNRYGLARDILNVDVKDEYEETQRTVKDCQSIHDGEIDRTVNRIRELEEAIENEEDDERRYELEIEIGECQGYLRELEEIDGEEYGTYSNGNPYNSYNNFDVYTVAVEDFEMIEDDDGSFIESYDVIDEYSTEDYDEAEEKYKEFCQKYLKDIVCLYHDTENGRDCIKSQRNN